ncbi:hypothetical protein D3C78_1260430 [compost metagenome]
MFERMQGRDRHIVEEAKAHGLAARGVVTWRAHRAERVFHFARHHGIGGRDGCARRMQGGRPGAGVDGGVDIDLRIGCTADQQALLDLVAARVQRRQVLAVMCAFDGGHGRDGRVAALQRIAHAADQQPVLDHIQPGRALGMPGAHLVLPAFFMGEIARLAHCHVSTVVFSANVVPCKHSTTSNRF